MLEWCVFFRSQKAFICNHDAHWLTVRKLGQQVQYTHIVSHCIVIMLLLFIVVQPQLTTEETRADIGHISQPLSTPATDGRLSTLYYTYTL